MQPRDYQITAVDDLRQAYSSGKRRVILCAPTGSGKTIIACQILNGVLKRQKRAVFVASARELIWQCSDKLEQNGIKAGLHQGILMSGQDEDKGAPIQVASLQTIYRRRDKMIAPNADVVFHDEAHLCGKTREWLLDHYRDAYHIGLTATPGRMKGGLGDLWQEIIHVSSYSSLIHKGHLVPTRVFAPSMPDLNGCRINSKTGEYVLNDDLASRMQTETIIGDIWEHWNRLGETRQTIGFAVNVRHSKAMANMFQARGITAAHVDCETDPKVRDGIIEQYGQGNIQVLWNYSIVSLGLDVPKASCVICCRPTKSLIWWRQSMNRVQRPSLGKDDALLIDHTGSIYLHGLPDSDMEWKLDPSKKQIESRLDSWKEKEQIVCSKCGYYRETGKSCPECGYQYVQRSKIIPQMPGSLLELSRKRLRKASKQHSHQKVWMSCLGIAAYKGWTGHVAVWLYNKRTGQYPRGLSPYIPDDRLDMRVRDLYPGFYRRRA